MKELCGSVVAEYVSVFLNDQFQNKFNIEFDEKGFYRIITDGTKTDLVFKIYPFWEKEKVDLFKDFSPQTLLFGEDVPGTVFFFLSGYFEYISPDKKDVWGNFPGKESFQEKLGLSMVPVADLLTEEVIVKKLNGAGFDIKLRNNRPLFFLTHDVDLLGYYKANSRLKVLAGDILKRKNIREFFGNLSNMVSGNDPCEVDYVLSKSISRNLKSTFFFMAEKNSGKYYGGYDISKYGGYLKSKTDLIIKAAGDVGLHYGVNHLEKNRLKNEVTSLEKVLGRSIKSGRAHYLIFDSAKSFGEYEKSGIVLDSTGGFSDIIGFRFGTCKLFRPFDFCAMKASSFIEAPLIIMDGTLKDTFFMNLSCEKAVELSKELIDTIFKYSGVFTLLWHNTSFFRDGWNRWEGVYESILDYTMEKKFVSVNGRDIINIFDGGSYEKDT